MSENVELLRSLESLPGRERIDWVRRVLSRRPLHGEVGEAVNEVLDLAERLEVMLEHTSDMITVLDADGLVRYSNRAAGLLTGHGPGANRTAALDFIHPDDQGEAGAAFSRCVDGGPGTVVTAELRIRHADGSWHHVDAYAANCLSDAAAGVVVSMRDVCDRVRAEQSLREANVSMRDFVAVASHDLRSPVAVLSGMASTLVAGWDRMTEQARREVAEVMARSAEGMGRLIENLLVISRLDAGVAGGRSGEVRVADTLRTVIASLSEPGAFRVEMDGDPVVRVDPDHLHRMLSNYLYNALTHGRPPVVIDALPAGDLLEVWVSDGGPGVPAEFVDRLFQRFSRGPASGRGTGLGLSIVRDLARAAGGDAWYRPDPPGFAFSLPLS